MKTPKIDPDFDPRPKRPPSPTFDAQAEIKAMAERTQWLCAHDNEAQRLMRESFGHIAVFHDTYTKESNEEEDELRGHIYKLIDLINSMPEALDADEREDPFNVTCFLDEYTKREAEAQNYITANDLREME